MAKLYFRYGTMNAGKSMQLMATAYNFQDRNVPYTVLKSAIDTRDVGVIHSRPIGDMPCKIIEPADNQILTDAELMNIEWILVDEAQFLTEEQVERLAYFVDEANINVMCFGLRSDFKTRLFPGSKRLFELADNIDEIKSSCSCGHKNIINARIDKDGNILTNGRQVEIGAEDRYLAMCRKCYFHDTYHRPND